jgi:serine/threonine-protein kinase
MGYSYEDAKDTLEAKGFVVKQGSSVYSDSIEAGLVAYSDPKAGAKVLPGATITLYISKGKENTEVEVPDLIGDTKKEARAKLKAQGLKLGTVTSNYSTTVEKNCICVQSKASGSMVEKGTTVDVTISLGQEPTYTYYSNSVTFDNPFDYETDPAATFKFVLSQDGKKTTIKTEKLSYNDFPYTLSDVKGSSTSQGEVLVYMNGKYIYTYNITFRKVAE